MASTALPPHAPDRSRLAWFALASLLLHGLVLGLGLGTDTGLRLPALGDTALRVEMAPAAAPTRRITTDRVLLRSHADRALRIRRPEAETPTPARADAADAHAIDAAAVQNYLLGVLQSELARYLRYPVLARERGWEGTVLVGVAVASNGMLTSARLLRSSGYPLLDEASLTSLRRIHTLGVETARLGREPVEVILPIRFRLADNG
jgi:TonB family protein